MWEVWGVLILFGALLLVTVAGLVQHGRAERRRFDEQIAASEARIRARHAKTPGRGVTSDGPPARTTTPGREAGPLEWNPSRIPPRTIMGRGGGMIPPHQPPAAPPRPAWYITAASIKPVIVPPPGPTPMRRPQPARTSHPGTGMIPRVRLSPAASTGEIRAVGDALIARIESGEL